MTKLFEQCKMGKLSVKNRFVRGATWECLADDKGHLTDELREIYYELARGGVGTIITGYAFVMEDEQPNPGMMGIYNDSFIAEYKELTDKVHSYDAKIIMQIVYGGFMTDYNVDERVIWGPSNAQDENTGTFSTEMTKEEIRILTKAFGDAARRAKAAGFDGVQIHCAHGYMLSQFISPYFNKREDEYGGSIENRARIVCEVYEAIRKEVGEDFLVTIKMNCTDGIENGGLTEEDALYFGKKLSEIGMDAIEISGGNASIKACTKNNKSASRKKIVDDVNSQSYFSDFAAKLAKEVSTPIILIGGNRNLELLEQLHEKAGIDFFSMSRPLVAEYDLIEKWAKDRNHKLKCIACNGCFRTKGKRCVFNITK